MGKRNLILLAAVGFALMFVVGSLYAGSGFPDVIRMENKAYSAHTRAIVDFNHLKHVETYNVGCGDCHHDGEGKPLSDLKMGDPVQGCIECHTIPGQMPADLKKEMREKKASREEIAAKELEYHAESIHANCVSCHRERNKASDTKAAPATCNACHPRE